jgi:choline dehydrogenase-like flavoprotein
LTATTAAATIGYSRRSQDQLLQLLDLFRPSPKRADLSVLDQENSFDVCIIGSGPAGTVLGKDLVGRGLKTIILESGLHLLEDPSDARIRELEVYRSSGSVDYPIASTRVRALGGTSNIWTGRCTRLYPLDFETNAYTPEGAAWPITYADLEPYYNQAEKTLRVRGDILSDYQAPRNVDLPLSGRNNISALRSLMAEADIVIDDVPTSTGRWSPRGPIRVATDLLPTFTKSPHATLLSGVTATQLIVESTGNVSGVEVQTLDRQVRIVRARAYVIACGALESARLLLVSRSPAFPDGIGNGHDLVGRFFMEHPHIFFNGRISKMPSSYQLGRTYQFYEQFKREGLGSVTLVFYWDPEKPNNNLKMAASLEMRPSPMNCVSLAPDLRDYFGNPGVDLSLNFTDEDLNTFSQARSLIQQIYADLGAENVREGRMDWGHHHMGTCRMGNDPATSVLDSNLRVHESSNLYVASSAAFVTCGPAHPTLALTALSHRLADHLSTILVT